MTVISIVGHSGSGKTTLVEKLIRELCARGVKVATIKHAHHKVELDTPGKDSFRYKEAGAVMSMLLTRDALQLVADAKEDRDPEQLAQRFLGEAESCEHSGQQENPCAKRHRRQLIKCDHLPMQNVEKIRLRISSAVVAPVTASMGRRAA